MELYVRRSQRSGGFFGTKIFFMLDAKLDLTEEEAFLVRKYRLGDETIYNSDDRLRYVQAAQQHFKHAEAASGTFVDTLAGIGCNLAAAGSLYVTVDSLTAGQHLECENLEALVEAEQAIRNAFTNLENYLTYAESYDGREEVHVPR